MESIDGVRAFLSGRYREIERDLEARMKAAAAAQEFEQAALERNRLCAVRSLLQRQRVANDAHGTLDAVAVAADGTDANAQVFQLRDGVLSDRQSFYLDNIQEGGVGEVAQEFLLQYYGEATVIPPQVIVQQQVEDLEPAGRAADRAPRRQGRGARGRARRQAPAAGPRRAQRAPGARPGAAEGRAPPPAARRGAGRPAGGAGLDALPLRVECFDISNLMGTHTVASMVVFEGGAPKKADYRRFTIRGARRACPTTSRR